MDEKVDAVLAKLQQIQQLWTEVQRLKPNEPEYKVLVEKIRLLSAEYQALIESSHQSNESK